MNIDCTHRGKMLPAKCDWQMSISFSFCPVSTHDYKSSKSYWERFAGKVSIILHFTFKRMIDSLNGVNVMTHNRRWKNRIMQIVHVVRRVLNGQILNSNEWIAQLTFRMVHFFAKNVYVWQFITCNYIHTILWAHMLFDQAFRFYALNVGIIEFAIISLRR